MYLLLWEDNMKCKNVTHIVYIPEILLFQSYQILYILFLLSDLMTGGALTFQQT